MVYDMILYVLHGACSTSDVCDTIVPEVSGNVADLEKMLETIVACKATNYVQLQLDSICEESGDRYYSVYDADGEWAKFYITEHCVKLSPKLNAGNQPEGNRN